MLSHKKLMVNTLITDKVKIMNNIELGMYGLVISYKNDKTNATITSNLKSGESLDAEFDLAVDVVESIILSHFCSGVDIESIEYKEGLNNAIETLTNKFL
jgi:hypothetical protein